MKWPLVILLSVGTVIAPAKLVAQDGREPHIPIGSRIPVWEEPQSEAGLNGTKVLYDFAECIAKRKEGGVRALLETMPASIAERTAVRKLMVRSTSCLTGASQMELVAFAFRGAVAEALYRKQIPDRPTLQPIPMAETYASLTERLSAASATPVDEEQQSTIAAMWVAYCSVHEDPKAVDELIRTVPGSDAEAAALSELRSTVSGCLFQDQRGEFTRLTLRTLLAEALYQFYFQRAGTA